MQYTENYSLKLPGYGDNADVGDLNDNTTAIDALIHANRQIEAPAFSTATAYTAGDMCVYENVLYKFTADKAAGNWDSTKVTATNLADEVTDAAQSGGTEVKANPVEAATADLHKLKVDTTVYGIPDPTVTKTATGNPIELTDAASAPMVKCVTQITGSQDLHGYDKPWVGGAGKNKLPLALADIKANNTSGTWSGNAYTVHGVTFTVLTDNGGNVTGIKAENTADASTFFNLGTSTISAGDYILNGCPANGLDSTYFLYAQNASGTYKDYGVGISISEASDISTQFTIAIRNGVSCNFTFYPMLRLASVTDPTFAPYSNICPITAYSSGEIEVSDGDGNVTTHTTTYPTTIYRGSEDVVNGEVTEEWKKVVFDGSNDEQWYFSINAGARSQNVAYITISDIAKRQTPIANLFEGLSNRSYNDLNPWQCASPSASGNETYVNFVVDKTLITSLSDWRTWLSNNNLEFAYELDTPTAEQISPTNLPIKSLSGYTHIESTTGDMEVEYITEGYQPLVDLIESNSGKHVYSTEEKVVGTWIDGKTIYEKTYTNATEQSVSYQTWTPTVISTTDIDRIVNLFTTRDADGGTYIPVVTRKENGYVEIFAAVGWTYNNITIQYTKTSSNNRSLSKGATDSPKADLSEEKKEIEELPTTEEKTVKKAQSEGEEVTEKTEKPVEEPTEKEENAGESNSENER